jgi:photosynthetic reaction center H subunit
MLTDPLLVGGLDIAELCVYIFFGFFLALVLYLRREDRREGYPVEEADTGRLLGDTNPYIYDAPKVFRLPFGLGEVYTPTKGREPVDIPTARRVARIPDSPLEPVGDPLASGVGPSAYARRADRPDVTFENHARIVPMRADAGFSVAPGDPDPRGWRMAGRDEVVAGEVVDLWVDRSDHLVRYLEVRLAGTGRTVLAPMTMATVEPDRRAVVCNAINAADFERAPGTAAADRVTLLEEERIVGFFGGGYLWGTPERMGPLV